jgi:hypothetical protein
LSSFTSIVSLTSCFRVTAPNLIGHLDELAVFLVYSPQTGFKAPNGFVFPRDCGRHTISS